MTGIHDGSSKFFVAPTSGFAASFSAFQSVTISREIPHQTPWSLLRGTEGTLEPTDLQSKCGLKPEHGLKLNADSIPGGTFVVENSSNKRHEATRLVRRVQ